ncbi:DUF3991 domain-containing protein [Planctomycetes bacterium TBK1r]|uniref:DUF3991 domain-containing protein n=1 Tax=Stieleria magnilauensis TaxID=2527963 RepID=A0ABX5XIR9_9BACT|nr:hypothetical protein TBK1r_01900 [Planctomycetes bacterium TBK1r]
MDSRTDEIERFKIEIPLARFAADEFGFRVDRRKSSANACFMRCDRTGDKISIQRYPDQHWTYWAVSPATDRGGSIIDFIQNRTGENLGQVRKRLRPYINGTTSLSSRPALQDVPLTLNTTNSDVSEVRRIFATTVRPLAGGVHPHLNTDRGIPPETFTRTPFAGSVHTDARGNCLFIHRDHSGVTGWEARNRKFKGFSPSGYKALWYATPGREERKQLVFAESAFDAIAYGLMFPSSETCYCSTAGQMSALQRDLVTSAINKLPIGGDVIIAADADQAGGVFAAQFQEIMDGLTREDLNFKIHAPESVKDWNDAWLVKKASLPSPSPQAAL